MESWETLAQDFPLQSSVYPHLEQQLYTLPVDSSELGRSPLHEQVRFPGQSQLNDQNQLPNNGLSGLGYLMDQSGYNDTDMEYSSPSVDTIGSQDGNANSSDQQMEYMHPQQTLFDNGPTAPWSTAPTGFK